MREKRRSKNLVEVLNPATRPEGRGHLVRVMNPGSLAGLDWAGAKIRFWDFRGREPKGTRMMEARPQTPTTLAELGGLVELVIDRETAKRHKLGLLGLKLRTNDDGDYIWKFNPAEVTLAADGDCELHIVGYYRKRPIELQRGVSHFLAEVAGVTYRAEKPHLHKGVNNYNHEYAEGGGEYPRLFYKDGYIFFRGGTYSLSEDGIEG